MIQSLAEWKFGSGHRDDEKNKPRAEQEPRTAHGRVVIKKKKCQIY